MPMPSTLPGENPTGHMIVIQRPFGAWIVMCDALMATTSGSSASERTGATPDVGVGADDCTTVARGEPRLGFHRIKYRELEALGMGRMPACGSALHRYVTGNSFLA